MAFRLSVGAVIFQLVFPALSTAQSVDNLLVWVHGFEVHDDGGSRPRVSSAGRGLVIGQTESAAIWKAGNRCVMGVAPRLMEPDAEIAWTIQTTPLRVVDETVTFRLAWRRERNRGQATQGPSGTAELTLRPGETFPIDLVDVLTENGESPCPYRRVGLRVTVDHQPAADDERSLVETRLWLVRRRPNGSQQVEPLSVRGLPGRPVPFYFSTVTDENVSLDFFGDVTVRPRDGRQQIELVTRSRLVAGGRETVSMPVDDPQGLGRRFFGARMVTSTVEVTPDEVVSVELPRLSENDDGAFSDQTFSITIQSRQIR